MLTKIACLKEQFTQINDNCSIICSSSCCFRPMQILNNKLVTLFYTTTINKASKRIKVPYNEHKSGPYTKKMVIQYEITTGFGARNIKDKNTCCKSAEYIFFKTTKLTKRKRHGIY